MAAYVFQKITGTLKLTKMQIISAENTLNSKDLYYLDKENNDIEMTMIHSRNKKQVFVSAQSINDIAYLMCKSEIERNDRMRIFAKIEIKK